MNRYQHLPILPALALLLTTLCLAGAALAGDSDGAPACDGTRVAQYLDSISDHYLPGDPEQADEAQLLFAFEERLAAGDRVVFVVETADESRVFEELHVREDVLAEELDLEGADLSRPAVVELLGGDGELRQQLIAAALEGSGATVKAFVNGHPMGERTVGELVEATVKLQQDGPMPVATESYGDRLHGSLLGPSVPAKSCQSDCGNTQDYCYDECVFSPGSGSCFDACDEAYDECIDACNGGGSCTPGSTTTTQETVVKIVGLGPGYCTYAFGAYDDYVYSRLRVRVTSTTVTTQANCSQTTQTSTSFYNKFCFVFESFTCNHPFLYPINICN